MKVVLLDIPVEDAPVPYVTVLLGPLEDFHVTEWEVVMASGQDAVDWLKAHGRTVRVVDT